LVCSGLARADWMPLKRKKRGGKKAKLPHSNAFSTGVKCHHKIKQKKVKGKMGVIARLLGVTRGEWEKLERRRGYRRTVCMHPDFPGKEGTEGVAQSDAYYGASLEFFSSPTLLESRPLSPFSPSPFNLHSPSLSLVSPTYSVSFLLQPRVGVEGGRRTRDGAGEGIVGKDHRRGATSRERGGEAVSRRRGELEGVRKEIYSVNQQYDARRRKNTTVWPRVIMVLSGKLMKAGCMHSSAIELQIVAPSSQIGDGEVFQSFGRTPEIRGGSRNADWFSWINFHRRCS